jgi:hypothetical protein
MALSKRFSSYLHEHVFSAMLSRHYAVHAMPLKRNEMTLLQYCRFLNCSGTIIFDRVALFQT